MSNKKILVWCPFPLLERNGGPSTYLYNLKLFLNSENFSIDYLSDFYPKLKLKSQVKTNKGLLIKKILHYSLPQVMIKKYHSWKGKQTALRNYEPIVLPFKIDLEQYDAIHFHVPLHLIQAKDYLKNYIGNIILTPHTPGVPYQSELDFLNIKREGANHSFYKKIIQIEAEAFQKANIIVLPCIQAVEAYQEGYLPHFDFNKNLNTKKIYTIPTGVGKSSWVKDKNTVRRELCIPSDAIVIHYSGRHNQEKGYDLLVSLAEKILVENENIYFLITGRINETIKYPKSKNWIEIGWSESPFDYANASDIFILPNRVTYFDLILVEMLSIGLPLMISSIGGNKFFEKYKEQHPIVFFESENIEDMKSVLYDFIYKLKPSFVKQTFLFQQYFNLEVFGSEYKKVYSEILGISYA